MAAKGALLRIALEIISMLGYSKGFSHSDVGTASDFDVHLSSLSHRWNGNAFSECPINIRFTPRKLTFVSAAGMSTKCHEPP
jgi:hypothetical protein